MITRQSTCLSVCLSNSALAFIHFSSTLGHENPLFQALDTEHSRIDVCRVWCGASEKTWLCREIMSSYRFPLPVLNDCELNISAIFSSLTNFADCIRLFCPGDGVLADSFNTYAHTHTQYFLTHTHPFNGPLSGTTWVSRYHKGKTNLDFTEARDGEWQWHQLDHMQVCTSLQTVEHSNSRFDSIRYAIRFVKKSAFRFTSCHAGFALNK